MLKLCNDKNINQVFIDATYKIIPVETDVKALLYALGIIHWKIG
jgi:hypothetical protein